MSYTSNLTSAALGLCLLTSIGAAVAQDGADKPKLTVKPPNLVEMKTSLGTIHIELDAAKAPLTVANFKKYIANKHYDNTIFHRVIDNFMIQGGGFEKRKDDIAQKKSLDPVKNEASNGLGNLKYTIAMARTSDPDSATAQFYINVRDNVNLNKNARSAGYTVFGKVVKGMDVVDKIKIVPTGVRKLKARRGEQLIEQPMQNVPKTDVVILSVRLIGSPSDDKGDGAADEKKETPKARLTE